MIEFDKGQHTARIILTTSGVSVNLNLDMNNIKAEPALRDSRLHELKPSQLKNLLEYVDNKFKVDFRSPLTWKEQFCRSLAKECDTFLKVGRTLTPEQRTELLRTAKQINADLAKVAKVSPEVAAPVMSVQYSGFNRMVMDDDFIAVRAGGRVVSMIPLRGNDYNEVKKYLSIAGEECLNSANIVDFKSVARKAIQVKALSAARNAPHGKAPSLLEQLKKA